MIQEDKIVQTDIVQDPRFLTGLDNFPSDIQNDCFTYADSDKLKHLNVIIFVLKKCAKRRPIS